MPLSEDEQRILHEMERRYYASDPESARRIRSTTVARYLGSNIRWSALGFVAGLAVLLASFATSWVLAVCGFAVMLASAVAFTQNMRRMGRHGMEQLRAQARARDVSGSLDATRRRLRRRFGDDS
ncbi:MAG TPA: DUF3040 domain-containing protein [Acidimicrobiales bacterium]|nr:DUF3040 domain-containing protein [Acidimicrobiales bacterium]